MNLNYPVDSVEDKRFFDERIQQIVDSMIRVEGERELVKSITTDLREAYGSHPGLVKKLAKALREESMQDLVDEVEEIERVFNVIRGDV